MVWLVLPLLPSSVTIGPPPAALDAHPTLLVLQLVALLLFTAAPVGFLRRAEATGDVLLRWLAAGSLLAAFSRLHYALYPSIYSEWVYTGDVLRLGFYAMLLAGAADRALDESRRAIAALSRDGDDPLDLALAQATHEVAERVGASVKLDLQAGADLAPAQRESLIRIAREAVSNAGRHSGARDVAVCLAVNGRVELRVRDHGIGFDPAATPHGRFGLVSMRERAEALGAEFQIISSPGGGTSVEVIL